MILCFPFDIIRFECRRDLRRATGGNGIDMSIGNTEEQTEEQKLDSVSNADEPPSDVHTQVDAPSAAEATATTDETTATDDGKPHYKTKPVKNPFYKSKKFYNFVTVPFSILFVALLRAVTVEVFILPYGFASGGATGIGVIIEYLFPQFSAGWAILLVNAPLLILSFIFLSKDFAIKTAIEIVLSSVFMAVLGAYTPLGNIETMPDVLVIKYPMLAAMVAGVLTGISLSIMLRIGGSTGGSDIVAMFIQKKFRATNVAWFISAVDFMVIIASFFVYDDGITAVLLSVLQMICLSVMTDTISSGFKTALKFEIITRHPDGLSKDLIEQLGRGVTCMPAIGMFSHSDTYMLVCVIRKRQLAEFNKILKKYPDTFAYVTSTSEVMGRGFSD